MELPKDDPMISEPMILEYLKKEGDNEWLFSFMGKIAQREPVLWKWMKQVGEEAIMRMALAIPNSFIHPLFSPAVAEELQLAMVRGYFMGMRKYESSWENTFHTTNFANERPKSKRKTAKKKPGDGAGEADITPDDLAP